MPLSRFLSSPAEHHCWRAYQHASLITFTLQLRLIQALGMCSLLAAAIVVSGWRCSHGNQASAKNVPPLLSEPSDSTALINIRIKVVFLTDLMQKIYHNTSVKRHNKSCSRNLANKFYTTSSSPVATAFLNISFAAMDAKKGEKANSKKKTSHMGIQD